MMGYWKVSDETFERLGVEYGNEFNEEESYLGDILYSMNDFDDLIGGLVEERGIKWLASVSGNFKGSDKFFYFDEQERLYSTDSAEEYFSTTLNREFFLRWCADKGYLTEADCEEAE